MGWRGWNGLWRLEADRFYIRLCRHRLNALVALVGAVERACCTHVQTGRGLKNFGTTP